MPELMLFLKEFKNLFKNNEQNCSFLVINKTSKLIHVVC